MSIKPLSIRELNSIRLKSAHKTLCRDVNNLCFGGDINTVEFFTDNTSIEAILFQKNIGRKNGRLISPAATLNDMFHSFDNLYLDGDQIVEIDNCVFRVEICNPWDNPGPDMELHQVNMDTELLEID